MLINVDGAVRRLPDFLIVGAAKSGTTSLYYYLRQHPALFLSDLKEPGYLCFSGMTRPIVQNGLPDMWRAAVIDLDTYAELFARAPHNVRMGEATPEYLLLSARTVGNVTRLYGDSAKHLRFIAILRNPVDRIWSHYWMMLRDGYENRSFDDATSPHTIASRLASGWHPAYDYVGYGLYGRQMRDYVDAFGADRVAVVLFDDLARDAGETCTRLFRFLEVDTSISPEVSVHHNPSGALRYPALHRVLFTRETAVKQLARRLVAHERLQGIKSAVIRWNSQRVEMPAVTRDRLNALYADEVASVGRLIGRDLSHWLRA
jgi:hypothetical protein